MNPILEQLAKNQIGRTTIARINVAQEPALARQFGVQSVPTLLVYRDGKILKRHSGFTNEDEILALIS